MENYARSNDRAEAGKLNWTADRWGLAIGKLNRISSGLAILTLAFISLATKLVYILMLGGGLDSFPREGTDVGFYNAAAMTLWKTGVFGLAPNEPNVGMPPGQSAFLALLYALSNGSIAFAKLAHVALLTGVAILIFFTGKELGYKMAGFWAGILIAVDPAQAYLAATFLSEPLFTFFMAIGVYLLARHRSDTSTRWLVGAGLCFALAGLTRNQGWLFAFALWLGALITWGRLIHMRAATIVLLITFAFIVPWTVRNYAVSRHIILVSSEGGLTLWSANNPEFNWRQPMPMSLPIYSRPSGLSDPEADQYYRQRAIEWIAANPIDFFQNGLRKLIVLFSFDPMSARPEVAGLYRLAGIFPYGILLPFLAIGLVANLRNEKFWIIQWYILFTTAMAFVFYGDSRIRAPIQPYLYLFAALGLAVCIAALGKWNASHDLVMNTTGDKVG